MTDNRKPIVHTEDDDFEEGRTPVFVEPLETDEVEEVF